MPAAPLPTLLLALALAADPRAELDALAVRQRAATQAARLLADQERSVLDGLDEVEAALAEAERTRQRAEADLRDVQQAVARAAADEAAAGERLAARLEALRPRLRERARLGPAAGLPALLSAPTLGELVKRRWLLGHLLEGDARLAAAAREALQAQTAARARKAGEAARLTAAAEAARQRRLEALSRREERTALLAALRSARALQERLAAEAAAQARKLSAYVDSLPAGRPGGTRTAFARRRGHLVPPADGPVSVGFGKVVNPKFNTVTVQNGLDIGAPAGAPVRAVAPGRVVHAGWFKGYGNLVIVDHGDGYHSLVAHLGSMQTAMGEELEAGGVLGTVGDSGSLKGAYLYFELREKGKPVDPLPWLAR